MKKKIIILLILLIAITVVLVIAKMYLNSKNKIDVYITTNHFSSKINKILSEEDNYKNKRASITGSIYYDESHNCYITRTYVGSSGKAKVGLLLKGKYKEFEAGDWAKVIGKINYVITDYEKLEKAPYIFIESIEKVKKQKDDEIVVN